MDVTRICNERAMRPKSIKRIAMVSVGVLYSALMPNATPIGKAIRKIPRHSQLKIL
jgi:hypothetical protein